MQPFILLYPNTALVQLEFDKVKNLLAAKCNTQFAHEACSNMRIHTHWDYIHQELNETNEYKMLYLHQLAFPNSFTHNVSKELQLTGIHGAMLVGEQLLLVRSLCDNAKSIFRWFDAERRQSYPFMAKIIADCHYEKKIIELIDEIIDDGGNVLDKASPELEKIRLSIFRKRNELRRTFEKVRARLAKAGFAADIDESFSRGRRVVAVFSEYKRQVKGIFHGESDTGKTAFIEPEETIELNNDLLHLESEEKKEEYRILRKLTASLHTYSELLEQYYTIAGEYDFISAKARLAIDMNADMPNLVKHAELRLEEASHPLLYLYNKANNKPTIPVNVYLNDHDRILIISGPNAGGKTVTMKTIGLNQVMLQSGLLVPVKPTSVMGIFKQLFMHIGDTQSIEFELSTYSSHLKHMKYFIETANGKTLFFIDELGSGSDPKLGASIAEVILEELARRHARGVVTTHYLNLKIMAGSNPCIFNGAMAFDEQKLEPMYRLMVGKPGSSYTFAIAERIGIPQHLINRAKKMVETEHYKLDDLLNDTEQNLQLLEQQKKDLSKVVAENNRMKKELETTLNKEKHQQQVDILKQKNKISEERIAYLKEMERKLKQIAIDWKKNEDKDAVMNSLKKLMFDKNDGVQDKKINKKIEKKYLETGAELEVGMLVKVKKNYQVGEVLSIKGKRAVVQIGLLPISYELGDLVPVERVENTN